jgi:hypothetical protein
MPIIHGHRIEVEGDTYVAPDIIEEMIDVIGENDDDTEETSKTLLQIYVASNEENRHVIDNVFVALCGYRISALVQLAGEVKLGKLLEPHEPATDSDKV